MQTVSGIYLGTNLPDGVYHYQVTATDEAGNTATVNNTVTIDTTAPDATFALSAATDSGQQGDFLTNIPQPVLTGKTEPGAHVILTLDGNVYEVIADRQGQWKLEITRRSTTVAMNLPLKRPILPGIALRKPVK